MTRQLDKRVSKKVIKFLIAYPSKVIPYKLDTLVLTRLEKMSGLNYDVNAPGRRKHRQLCHINMFKQNNDRDDFVHNQFIVKSVSQGRHFK